MRTKVPNYIKNPLSNMQVTNMFISVSGLSSFSPDILSLISYRQRCLFERLGCFVGLLSFGGIQACSLLF